MSLTHQDRREIEKLIEVDKDEILDILKDYPGAAILLALDQDCTNEVLEEFKRIAKDYRRMKNIITHILEQEQDGEMKISPALRDSMKEFKKDPDTPSTF